MFFAHSIDWLFIVFPVGRFTGMILFGLYSMSKRHGRLAFDPFNRC